MIKPHIGFFFAWIACILVGKVYGQIVTLTACPNGGTCPPNAVCGAISEFCECNAGFRLSVDQLSCVYECQLPSAPTDGYLDPATGPVVLDGAVTYKCNTNFAIIGNATHTCTATGWDGTAPTCGCAMLPDIPGGSQGNAKTAVTPVDGLTTYSCNGGLTSVGDDQMECRSGTGWEGTPPECKCALPAILNGNVTPNNGTVSINQVATYTCNTNFALDGSGATRTCTINGWSASPPTCNCIPLSDIDGGNVVVTGYAIGGIATYSCGTGLSRNGDNTRTCTTGVGWSGTKPTCECNLPTKPTDGSLTPSTGTVTINSSVTYQCSPNFALIGNSARRCTVTGWNGADATCGCQTLTISNGAITSAALPATFPAPVGTTVSYVCNSKYTLRIVAATRTCQTQTGWDGTDPTCVQDCGQLRAPTNGNVKYADTILGSVANYTCDANYRIVGSSSLTCQPDSAWSNPEPTCIGDCGPLSNITNGRVEYSDTIVGNKATYLCNNGFKLVGSAERTCNAGSPAAWSSVPPTCVAGIVGDDCSTITQLCSNIGNGQCSAVKCACLPGFQADSNKLNCVDIDECLTTPCQNQGNCTNGANNFTCACAIGWEGHTCNINPNNCVPNPCVNAVSCQDGLADYTCTCLPGYDGKACSNDINECVGNQCWANQSQCVDQVNGYVCVCSPGFNDSRCSTNINECVNHNCRNGAICHDGINKYTCQCLAGWQGPLCENGIDECENNNKCENGGACIDGLASFRCACRDGYTGDFCQEDINDCIGVTACQNGGVCKDKVNGYTCDCLEGYEGQFCGTETKECASNPCQNNGVCIEGIAKFTCTCLPGFNGILCENAVNECIPNPCGIHGVCTDLQADYRCTCANGYTGRNCSEDIDECLSSPCGQNGRCINLVNSFVCICNAGYEGLNCNNNIDDCKSHQCENGAVCVDQLLNYTCRCVAGYTGRYCETNINECASNPCDNDAMCIDGVNGYTCVCEAGWTGIHCQTNIIECASNPCQNGGTCKDKVNAFECACTAGHTGETCRTTVLGDSCAEREAICSNIINSLCSGTSCVCQAGYEKTGPSTCNPVNCGTIAPPEHGSVNHDEGTQYQDKAYFACNTGYFRNGLAFVTCQNNMKWSGEKPTCEDINECASNPCKNGGTCTDKLSGYTCACQPGFGGTTCIRDCGLPASIAHGSVTYQNGTLQGHVATYSCNQGYLLSGTALSECLSTGVWSEFGECFVVGVAYDQTCAVTAQCATKKAMCRNDGLGSFRCLCKVSGEIYDLTVDTCLIDCGTLTNPTNGEVKLPATTAEGQVASYLCFVGYGLAGSKFRTCQSDGRWSYAAPACVFGCPEPDIPANGRVNSTNGLAVGQTIYYSCIDGFELVGQTQRICEAASTWSGTEPTCMKQCPVLEALSHGKVDMSWGRHEGSIATYSCENNYALIGDPIMTCQSSGVWGGMQPECVFAMFPDILLVFGSILILLVIVDAFVVGVCVYYRYCRTKPPTPEIPSPQKPPFPEAFYEDGETGVPPRDITLAPFRGKQKFSKVTPEDSHPPPQRVDEPNVVYRSRMKMSDQVLDSIFSKGSKYRRNEDGDERLPYLDDGIIHDRGYNTGNSNSMDDARSEEFDKHLDLTHSTPGPIKSPRETQKPEEPEEEEEDEDRFRFKLRGPPPNIADALFKEKETTLAADDKRRSKSAFPGYRVSQKYY